MTDVLSPAQQEQEQLKRTAAIAVRESEFGMAPAFYPDPGEWGAIKEMARALCITEFVPKDMRGRPYAVLGALLTGRDLGLPPMMALRQIYVVNGRPALQGAVKAALVRRAGHKITVAEWTNEKCTVRGWRKGDPPDEVMEVTYTIDDAKQAGDYDKPGDMYKKRPRQMLHWRALGLLCDTYFADVTLGLPEPEEAAQLEAEPIEAQYREVQHEEQLPALRTDMPLTDAERADVEKERQAEAAKKLADSPPPPPPRTRGRGRGPKPNPQQGSDSGVSPGGDVSSPTEASPASAGAAAPSSSTASTPAEEAEQPLPPAASGAASTEDAQTSSSASSSETDAGESTESPSSEESSPDPFGPPPMARLTKQAEDYADFLMRTKLEKAKMPATDLEDLHKQALAALEQICRQMFGHGYGFAGADCTEEELSEKLIPWLRQRYAAQGGKE